MMFLSACGETSESEKAAIRVLTPMTISENTINGKKLTIEMIEGKYYEDWTPSPYMGKVWEGKFVFNMMDESGTLIMQSSLPSIIDNEEIIFTRPFSLVFNDYNNDGNLDFTIGQYGTINGNYYKLYTIRNTGKIDELRIVDHKNLFISNATGQYSTELKKCSETGFIKSYYDNATSETIEDSYEWQEKEFKLIRSNKSVTQ